MDPCDSGTEGQGSAYDQQPPDHDVRAGVGDAIKDRVMFERQLKTADVHSNCKNEQKECDRGGECTPWRRAIGDMSLGEGAGAACNDEKQYSNRTGRDRKRE